MIRRDENSINIFHDKKNEAGYKRVLPGQFVIHLRSFQGGFAHSAIEGITSPAYTVFGFSEPEKHDSEYWKYVFTSKSFIQRLETVTYGIRDGRSISYEEFLTLGFVYPSKAEQTAIARYLDKLSDLITLHQRQPFLHSTPDISLSVRLIHPFYTSSWEQRKLGELAVFNPKEEIPDAFEYVDLESVVGTEMLSHRTEEKATAPSRAQRLAHTGDLFYQTVRPYQKNNYLFEKPDKHYVFSTGYAQLRPFIDGYFLLSLVQNGQFVKTVLDNCTGTSYPAINANDLAEIEVFSPKDEQEHHQIGTYFRNLDNLITLHQRKGKAAVSGCFLNCFSLEKSSAQSRTLELFGQISNQEIKYIIDGLSILGGKLRNFCVKLIILLSYTRINDIAKYHISRNTECVHNIN